MLEKVFIKPERERRGVPFCECERHAARAEFHVQEVIFFKREPSKSDWVINI